jgi:hypothetical protein
MINGLLNDKAARMQAGHMGVHGAYAAVLAMCEGPIVSIACRLE